MLPNPTTGRSGRLPSFSLRLRPRRLAGALIWQLLIGHPEETSGVDLYMGQDKKKSASNLRKQDVTFEEAATAFGDARSLTTIDPDHSIDEERFILLGASNRGRLLVVAHTEQLDTIRIISARLATRGERKIYEEA